MNPSVANRQDAVNIARTPAGDALSLVVVRVFQLSGLLLKSGDALAKPQGQTSARWQVLAAIETAPASVAAIAHMLSLARQSVQRVADLLVEDGLAEYEANPAHRRSPLLRLSERGRAVLSRLQAAQRPWADALAEHVGEDALRAALPALDSLLAALRPTEPKTSHGARL
jgi:DNA-binding MarR family transcriptional regulator